MPSHDEPVDTEWALPTLEDFREPQGRSRVQGPIGRPRKNPLATQKQLKKFQAEYHRREREKLNNARTERKAEIDEYVEALFASDPDMQAFFVNLIQHVFEFARRDEDPLTEYDARTYAMRAVMSRIKHIISREETIKYLQAQHEARVAEQGAVTIESEVTVTETTGDPDLDALMAEGLPGGDYGDEEGDGLMTYPEDWKIG